jgi:hypothetical protein
VLITACGLTGACPCSTTISDLSSLPLCQATTTTSLPCVATLSHPHMPPDQITITPPQQAEPVCISSPPVAYPPPPFPLTVSLVQPPFSGLVGTYLALYSLARSSISDNFACEARELVDSAHRVIRTIRRVHR